MQDEASDASSRQQISPGLHTDLQQQGGLAALLVANLLRAMHLGGHAGKLGHWSQAHSQACVIACQLVCPQHTTC